MKNLLGVTGLQVEYVPVGIGTKPINEFLKAHDGSVVEITVETICNNQYFVVLYQETTETK